MVYSSVLELRAINLGVYLNGVKTKVNQTKSTRPVNDNPRTELRDKSTGEIVQAKAEMSNIASLLQASLQPASRKQAEQQLHALASQQGFLAHLLTLILDGSYDHSTRLAGGIYLKNISKLRWEEVHNNLSLIMSIHLICGSNRTMHPSRKQTKQHSDPSLSQP